jgi:hypothetical protein
VAALPPRVLYIHTPAAQQHPLVVAAPAQQQQQQAQQQQQQAQQQSVVNTIRDRLKPRRKAKGASPVAWLVSGAQVRRAGSCATPVPRVVSLNAPRRCKSSCES